jgi:O-antigen ligase
MLFRIQVLLVFEIAAAIVTLARPFWGLLLLNLLVFVRPQDDRPNMAQLHMPMVIMIAVAVATIGRIDFFSERRAFAVRGVRLLTILFFLMFVSSFLNGWTLVSRAQLEDTLSVMFLCVLMLVWINTQARLKVFLWSMMAAGFYHVRTVISDPSFMREEIGGQTFDRLSLRGAINFGNPNFMAILMIILAFIAIALIGGKGPFWKKPVLLALLAGYVYVFLKCESRGATLGLSAGLFTFWLLQKKKLLLGPGLLIGVTLSLVFLAPKTYLERLKSIINYKQDASATGRLTMWAISREVIAENPIFGIGVGNFEPRYPRMSEHNAYLQVASEVGIPALFLYVGLLIGGFRSALRARWLARSEVNDHPFLYHTASGLICALVAISVQGFFTGFAFREFVYITLMLAYCVRGLAEDEIPSSEPEEEEQAIPADFAVSES